MNPAPPNYPPSADAAMAKIDLVEDGRGARQDPGGVDQALRLQVGAEELRTRERTSIPTRCDPRPGHPVDEGRAR